MGNNSSFVSGGSESGGGTLGELYKKAATEAAPHIKDALHKATSGEVTGGTCGNGVPPIAGGYSALQDYGNSVFSKAKEDLIRGIASDVASSLKVNASFAKSAPIGKVVEKLQKFVPDPRKGKHFVKDKGSQEKVCRTLAKSINKRYGSNMIDPDSSPEAICKSVGEMMYSLFTGLHTEFLAISGDIGRSVQNLTALRDYVDATNKRLVQLVKESGNQAQQIQADNVYSVYEKIRQEIDRQLAILTNNVNSTTGPLGKSLVALLEENGEFKGLVRDLRVSTGSDAFGDKLGYLLSGISSVSHAAYLIDKNLKVLGMTVAEYKNSKTLGDLRQKVYTHMAKKNPGSLELRKMLEAADIIYKTDYDHANIVKYLETKMSRRGGDSHSHTNSSFNMMDLESATEKELGMQRGYMSRKSVGLQMKEHEHFRKMLFVDLKKLLRSHYQKIIENVSFITKKIGNEIPISNDLYKFVKRFEEIESPDRENLHIALSGYRKDVTSRHIKNVFMASLHAINKSLEPLKTGPQGQKFREIQDSISQLIKSIDDFSDKFVKSITNIPVNISKTPRRGGVDGSNIAGSAYGGVFSEGSLMSSNAFLGGDDGSAFSYGGENHPHSTIGSVSPNLHASGGIMSPAVLKQLILGGSSHDEFDYFTTVGKVKKELSYYYSIANLKSNMARSSRELDSYGADYENILGDEIAAFVDQTNDTFNREIKLSDYTYYANMMKHGDSNMGFDNLQDERVFKKNQTPGTGGLGKLLYEAKEANDSGAVGEIIINESKAEQISSTYKYIRTYQKNAKIGLFKAAEALDLYMKHFTNSIVAHPEDVNDLVGMLGQISIVAKWFTNRTGDHLSAVFESWPSDVAPNGKLIWAVENAPDDGKHPGSSVFSDILQKEHYYVWVDKNKSRGVGNPNIPWFPINGHKEVQDIYRRIEKSYRGIRALENIVSTFSRLGDKFGNKSIKNSSFMSHGQIYKSISDYLVASSISVGSDKGGLAIGELFNRSEALRKAFIDKEKGYPDISSSSAAEIYDPLSAAADAAGPGLSAADEMAATGAMAVGFILTLGGAAALYDIRKNRASSREIINTPGAGSKSEELNPDSQADYFADPNTLPQPPNILGGAAILGGAVLSEPAAMSILIAGAGIFFYGLAQYNQAANLPPIPGMGSVGNLLKRIPTKHMSSAASFAKSAAKSAANSSMKRGWKNLWSKSGGGNGGGLYDFTSPAEFEKFIQKAATSGSSDDLSLVVWTMFGKFAGINGGIPGFNKSHPVREVLGSAADLLPVQDLISSMRLGDDNGGKSSITLNEAVSVVMKLFEKKLESPKDNNLDNAYQSAFESVSAAIQQGLPGQIKNLSPDIRSAYEKASMLNTASKFLGGRYDTRATSWLPNNQNYNQNPEGKVLDKPLASTQAMHVLKKIGLTLRSTDGRETKQGFDNFSNTDHIFELMMKSMVCKVLTTVGVFALFNRPGVVNRSISPLRMILGAGEGGGISEFPPVIDDAVELYIRLPLLAEWYRDKFNFRRVSKKSDSDAYTVSMVPSFDGIWSDFISIIFIDTDYVKDGTYTEMTLKKLIMTINDIYKKYQSKYPKSTVREVINAFVTEINRRYGFVKRSEITSYIENTRNNMTSTDKSRDPYSTEDRVDYDVIDEDADYGRGPAPSDKFQTINPKPSRHNRFKERQSLVRAVQEFRERVEVDMMGMSANFETDMQDKNYSFVENILQVTQKLQNSKNAEEKYSIVRDAVQGVNKYAGISYEKTLMFNEVVITPLAILTSIHDVLDAFTTLVHGTNTRILQRMSMSLNKEQFATMAENMSGTPEKGGFLASLAKVFNLKYPYIGETKIEAFVAQMSNYVNSKATYWDEGECGNAEPIKEHGANSVENFDSKDSKDLWRRFIVDRKRLMKDLINSMFCIGCDLNGLVEIRITSGGVPVMNYSKLQELTTILFNQTKSAIGEFRNVISIKTIQKYESGTQNDENAYSRKNKYTGSLLWVEERLIEKLFNNRDKAGLPEVNESLAASWLDLNRAWSFDGSDLRNPHEAVNNRDSYDAVISELLYWDNTTTKYANPRTKGLYSEYPSMYIPIFKSGNFEPVTHGEKMAYSQLSKIASVSEAVLSAEEKFEHRKFAQMLTLGCWDSVAALFSTKEDEKTYKGINKSLSERVQEKSPADEKEDGIDEKISKTKTQSIEVLTGWFSSQSVEKQAKIKALPPDIVALQKTNNELYQTQKLDHELKILFEGNNDIANYSVNKMKSLGLRSKVIFDLVDGIRDVSVAESIDSLLSFLLGQGYSMNVRKGNQITTPGYNYNGGIVMTSMVNRIFDGKVDPTIGKAKNIHAVLNSLPFLPTQKIQDGGISTPIDGLAGIALKEAAKNIASRTNNSVIKKSVALATSNQQPSLSQLHLLGICAFGSMSMTEFSKNISNPLLASLHGVANSIYIWLSQELPPPDLKIGFNFAQSYKDTDNSGGTMKKELTKFKDDFNKILADVVESRGIIEKNKFLAKEIGADYTNMLLIDSYQAWHLQDPANLDSWKYSDSVMQGIIPMFNELLARYVTGFSDRTQFAKLYLPLIESFANSSASREIMQNAGIKDVNFKDPFRESMRAGEGVIGDPPNNTVLFASLARVIKSIVTRIVVQTQQKYHLTTNFIEIPEFLKEAMRASLPVFDKEFEYLKRKAQFLKSILEGGNVVSVRKNFSKKIIDAVAAMKAAGEYKPEPGIHAGMNSPVSTSNASRSVYLIGLINTVVSHCNAIQRCSEIVQKELSDVPLYGEFYEGSLKEFRSRHNKNPLTPISSLTYLLNSQNSLNESLLTPAFGVGTAKFKQLYSTRLILAQNKVEPRMDYMPGLKDIIHQYNAVSNRSTQAPSYYGSMFQQMVVLMRYITDITQHKSILGKIPRLEGKTNVSVKIAPQQFGQIDLEEINGLTENNDVKRASMSLVKKIEKGGSEGIKNDQNRKTLRLYNILDLNIVPINFHAMQREIPLINLYNYAYTFDRMTQEILVPEWNGKKHIKSIESFTDGKRSSSSDGSWRLTLHDNTDVNNTRTMLAKCLIYPHGHRKYKSEYLHFIRRIMMGASELHMGRPKFNSDQLWSKVLFQDLYTFGNVDDNSVYGYDESGPPVEFGKWRGWASQNTPADREYADSTKVRWSNKLSYRVIDGAKSKIKKIDLSERVKVTGSLKGMPEAEALSLVGYQRYNTHIVRNMEWFVNLQRFMRHVMRKNLNWLKTPVVRGTDVLNSNITEYVENEAYTLKDFN
jgi:hypothetical protein